VSGKSDRKSTAKEGLVIAICSLVSVLIGVLVSKALFAPPKPSIMTGCQQPPTEDAPTREQGEIAEPLQTSPNLDISIRIIQLSGQGSDGVITYEIANNTRHTLRRVVSLRHMVEYFDGEIWRVLPVSLPGGVLVGLNFDITPRSIAQDTFPPQMPIVRPAPFISGGLYRIRENFSFGSFQPVRHDVVAEFYWP